MAAVSAFIGCFAAGSSEKVVHPWFRLKTVAEKQGETIFHNTFKPLYFPLSFSANAFTANANQAKKLIYFNFNIFKAKHEDFNDLFTLSDVVTVFGLK